MKKLYLLVALLIAEIAAFAQTVASREYKDSYIYAYIKSDTYQGNKADYVYIHNLSTTPVQVTLLENAVIAQLGSVVDKQTLEKKVKIDAGKAKRVSTDFGNNFNYKHSYVTAFRILTVQPIEEQHPSPRQVPRTSQPNTNEKRVFNDNVDFSAEIRSNTGNDILTKSLSFNELGVVVLEENTWTQDGRWTGERVMTCGYYYIIGNTIYLTWEAFDNETPITELLTISQDWESIIWGSIYLRKDQ